TMDLMDALGLADRLLELPHAKIHRLMFDAPSGPVMLADLSRLRTKFPYITMMPQARFLDFLAGELRKMPNVQLIMGAAVNGLLWGAPWGLSGVADRPPPSPASHAPVPGPASGGGGPVQDAQVAAAYSTNGSGAISPPPVQHGSGGRGAAVDSGV